jgi:thiol-disulfide isomerase/thioredoxin
MKRVLRALALAFLVAPVAVSADTPAGYARVFDLTGLGPRLVLFSDEKAARDLAVKGPVVYYFAASWCPDCREDYEDLKANLYRLPANLTVVFVDFDNAADLKRRYGVPIQDVFVQINAKGDKLKLWVGGGSASLTRNLVHPGA